VRASPCALLALAACGGSGAEPGADPAGGGSHAHRAPHGGLLIELGEELAHVELFRDPETGALTAWLLDGEAEQAVRSAQTELRLVLLCDGEERELVLQPAASALTGETAGDTSEYRLEARELGTCPLSGRLARVEVLGRVFEDVPFAPGAH